MAEERRYYWLKLKEDFFTSKRIKKLRGMAGGDTYLIIYLKLQLKTMKNDGIVKFDHLESTIAEELALDIDENVDDVKVTLAYLVGCGLAETNDEMSYMFFPYAVENVGSESTAAERMRNARKQNKPCLPESTVTDANNFEQCSNNVEQCSPSSEHCYGDIEKEKERDKDKENTDSKESVRQTQSVRRVIEAWNALGLSQISKITSTSTRGQCLNARIREYGIEKVLEAIERIRKSSFLRGQSKSGWTIKFDWLVKPNNFPKVLEGQYDDKSQTGNQNQTRRSFLEIMGVDDE